MAVEFVRSLFELLQLGRCGCVRCLETLLPLLESLQEFLVQAVQHLLGSFLKRCFCCLLGIPELFLDFRLHQLSHLLLLASEVIQQSMPH